MANTSRAGLRPVKPKYGGASIPALIFLQAADRTADTTGNHGDIYIGDPVALSGGKAIVANSNANVIGVCVAVGKGSTENTDAINFFNMDTPSQQYAPLTDAGVYWVLIARANDWIFEGETATALTKVVGDTMDLDTAASTAHGSQTTSQSNCRLTTSSNADVKVVENNQDIDNVTTTIYGKYRFEFLKLALL